MTAERASKEGREKRTQPETRRPDGQADGAQFAPESEHILRLQHLVGNQAVQRMLAQGQVSRTKGTVQFKLTVGEPDDAYEQEADEVARAVMRMPEPAAPPADEDEIQAQKVSRAAQRQENTADTPPVSDEAESRIESRRGRGQALPDSARAFFEPRFGQDFSGVQIHTGSEADSLNRELEARAFTTGQDIFFRDGEYNPESSAGRELLAHELTHVVQQGGGIQRARRIQRFGSLEHQELGNAGSGSHQAYEFGANGVASADARATTGEAFRLTHGDIVMLSGDYFDPRDTIMVDGTEQPNPDSLFQLARRPSPNPGQTPGTQDEIIYAIKSINPGDPRFAQVCTPEQPQGGVWSQIEFSDAVKQAVDSRYLRLAANNAEHFVNPTGAGAAAGGAASGMGASAGGSYRALHEQAILYAFSAGQQNTDIGEAMAREAAAQHFLTDAFAAGHLRTPRAAIRTHWQGIYPLFWNNLRSKIALDVARWNNENITNLTTIFGTVNAIYTGIRQQVNERTADMPALGFDDLVSMVAHDTDNEQGLWVINDIGERWKTFGDSNLHAADPDNRTAEMAQLAVRVGNADIQNAYRLGQSQPEPMSTAWVTESVRSQTVSPAVPGEKYGPEQIMPRLDPSAETSTQNWEADSLDALWTMQVRSDQPLTYGEAITASIRSGEIHEKLAGMAERFPEVEEEHGLRPRDGFVRGFVNPFVANPLVGLRSVIDFNPSEGQAGFNEDDAVMEEMAEMSEEQMRGYTLNQRADRVRALIGGYVGENEGEQVIQLFRTAPASERAQLYRLVEGHAWTGDWIEGVFTTDDDIVDALTRAQLNTLRGVINGE